MRNTFILILICNSLILFGQTNTKNQWKKIEEENAKKQDSLLNKKAPGFHCKDESGNIFDLGQLKGKVVVINFWATWCGPCKKEMPELNKLVQEFKSDTNVVFISFCRNWDPQKIEMKNLLGENAFNYNIISSKYSEKVSKDYFASTIPTNGVINKNGELVSLKTGYFPRVAAVMRKAIQNSLKN